MSTSFSIARGIDDMTRLVGFIISLLLLVSTALPQAPVGPIDHREIPNTPLMGGNNGQFVPVGIGTGLAIQGGNLTVTSAPNAGGSYDLTAYGAKCDAVANSSNVGTDDSAAINAMFAAIRAANAPFRVTTPRNRLCLVKSTIDATGFNNFGVLLGQGSSIELRLICRTSGTPCVDAMGSRWINWPLLFIKSIGSSSASATSLTVETGTQNLTVATGLTWPAVGTTIAINSTANPQIYMLGTVTSYRSGTGALVVNVTTTNGSGTFASWTASNLPNVGIQFGRTAGFNADLHYFERPIITGPFLFANFYNFAAETTSVIDPYIENDFAGGVSYGVVQDGQNHWNIQSIVSGGETVPPDTAESFNENTFLGGWYSSTGQGVPIWMARTNRHNWIGTYSASVSANCIQLYASVNSNQYLTLNHHCETKAVTDAILLTGPNAMPTLNGFTYRDHSAQPSNSLIKADTGINSVVANDLTIEVGSFAGGNSVKVFDNAALWTISNVKIQLPNIGNWTPPNGVVNAGQVCVGQNGADYCDYAVPTAPSNRNPDFLFDHAHAGASSSGPFANGALVIDGWHVTLFGPVADTVVTQQVQTSPCGGYPNALKLTTNALHSFATTEFFAARQAVETVDLTDDLAWGTPNALPITVDFWAYANNAGTYNFALANNGVNPSYVLDVPIAQANVCQHFSFVVPGPTTPTWGKGASVIGLFAQIVTDCGPSVQTPAAMWTTGAFYCSANNVHMGNISGAFLQISGFHIARGIMVKPYRMLPASQQLLAISRHFDSSFLYTNINGIPVGQNRPPNGALTMVLPYPQSTFDNYGVPIRFRQPMFASNNNGNNVPTMTGYSTGAASANCYNRTKARDSGVASFSNTNSTGTFVTCTLVPGDAVGDQLELHWTADTGL
jgi:hypothetical protein